MHLSTQYFFVFGRAYKIFQDYAYQAIPKDPLSGRRVWRNNKASAAGHGFIMDNSVQDQKPTAEHPNPQVDICLFNFQVFCHKINKGFMYSSITQTPSPQTASP